MTQKALTLLELLTVIAILLLVAALSLPALRAARYRGHDAVCISNMRQILMAVGMYRSDYHQEFPKMLNRVLPYVRTQTIFHCPVDKEGGIAVTKEIERIPQLSYYYVGMYTLFPEFLTYAPPLDPNHGVIACVWHPISNWNSWSPFTAPFVRRGLLDGSVQTVRKRKPTPDELDPREPDNEAGNGCFNGWILFTNAPCPLEYCRHPDCFD
ncbi:MAG: type II secretion system protein [Armatimonadetes bacterium]|nr:MAG: type II secretion system protein [Armatimonadota bacterium]